MGVELERKAIFVSALSLGGQRDARMNVLVDGLDRSDESVERLLPCVLWYSDGH